MKKKLALFTLFIVGLGAISTTLPKKWRGSHRRNRRYGFGGSGFGGFGGFGIGLGGRRGGVSVGLGTPYSPYYSPYRYRPYSYGYPSTVVIEKEPEYVYEPARSYLDKDGHTFWEVTNTTNQTINVITNADSVSIRPGATENVNRGKNFNVRIDGKRFKVKDHYIEVVVEGTGFNIQTS